jgi:VanZ family protein
LLLGVHKGQQWADYWWPVFLCMGLIYMGSTDILSGQRTSRFLAPLLRWLKPDISAEAMQRAQLVIRKMGHLTEYALLAGFVCRALSQASLGLPTSRPTWMIWGALGWAILFAVSDEIHQSFYVTRQASAWDVLIDACGACLGVGWWWGWNRLKRKRS